MTPEQLALCTGASLHRAATWLECIESAMTAFDINTPARQAAFLAQIGHESGSLRWCSELWGPTPAQTRYEGRADLGNTEPGDGSKYRGHGLVQVTGRVNHAAARDRLRAKFGDDVPDFEAEPERLAEPKWAALSAAEFWASHGCNDLADAGNIVGIGRFINRGSATSKYPANGEADRLARYQAAAAALGISDATPAPPSTTTPGAKPMLPIIAALLPSLIDAVPKLAALFGAGGSEVATRNVKAAELAFNVAKDALGAVNEQEVVDKLKADPQAVATVAKAIEDNWFSLSDAGGGGIEGARKADAQASGGDLLKSASFWVALCLLPLVYLFVFSLIGLIGTATWSDDVRAGLAGSVISAVIGGLVGYYFGQTTSRNRTPVA